MSEPRQQLKARLREQVRIYRDNPSTQANYADIARVIEDILQLVDSDKKIGFKPNDNETQGKT